MDLSKIKVGDVFLYHGHTWLAKQIIKWMNKYRIKKGLKERSLYNHVAVVIDLWGTKWVVEAVAKGVVMTPLTGSTFIGNSIHIKTWAEPLDKTEKESISWAAVKLVIYRHKYDYFNFLWNMIKIKTGWWLGPKDNKAKKVIYCSELAAILMDGIRSSFDGVTYDKTPLDIDLSKDLIDLKI